MTRFITLTAVLGGLLFVTTANAQCGGVAQPVKTAPQVAQTQPTTVRRAYSYEPTAQAPVRTYAPAPMYRGTVAYRTGGGVHTGGWNQAGWKQH